MSDNHQDDDASANSDDASRTSAPPTRADGPASEKSTSGTRPQRAHEDGERDDAPTKWAGRPSLRLSEERAAAYEDELRGRLGVLPRGVRLPDRIRRAGWIATVLAGILAFATRFWNLTHPRAIVFDETYYVKGAFSLLTKGYEGTWQGDDANDLFLRGDYSALSNEADYVVHPPFGKWVMAIGQWLFGTDNGVGWRFSTAILGVLSVVLVVRIAMRMFRSPLLAGFAGLAMALDGMGIVMSRTGILDNVLAFFVLVGFWALLVDRERHAKRLAHRVARADFRDTPAARQAIAEGRAFGRELVPTDPWGPNSFARPWLVVAGLSLGLACGVKWSGIYAVAAFGVLALLFGILARRAVGVPLWFGGATFRDGLPAFFQLVPTAVVAYIGAWTSWFLNPHAWDREWARETTEKLPWPWAPETINSFVHYHQEMWNFHHSLSEDHTYQSQAWEWIIQGRPVSFYWLDEKKAPRTCGGSKCVEAITSLGNVAVWWLAIVGLIIVLLAAIMRSDWRAWAILAGYAGLWMPWMVYIDRTIFQFYAVAFLPFVVLALTFGVAVAAQLLGPSRFRWSPSRAPIIALNGPAAGVPAVYGGPPPGPQSERAEPATAFHPDGTGPTPHGGDPLPGKDDSFVTRLFDDAQYEHPFSDVAQPCEPGERSARADDADRPTDATTEPGVRPKTLANRTLLEACCSTDTAIAEDPAIEKGTPNTANSPARFAPIGFFPAGFVAPDEAFRERLATWWLPRRPRKSSWVVLCVVSAMIVATAAFWYPLWTGQTVTHGFWKLHMWFPSWI